MTFSGKKLLVGIFASAVLASQAGRDGPWTKERAWEWYNAQPWIRGCNYMPASCANRVDQWQELGSEERFEEMGRELDVAESIGFNTLRILVELQGFGVWIADHDGFMERFERTLQIMSSRKMRAIVVLGNDCMRPKRVWELPKPGPQSCDIGYHGGRKQSQHGSFPDEIGHSQVDDPVLKPKFFAMCEELMAKYRDDDRILFWDIWNEPGNSRRGTASVEPLKELFAIAWKINPKQPLAADLWIDDFGTDPAAKNQAQVVAGRLSDIVSYHCYGDYETQVCVIRMLKRHYGRPMVNTEWLARIVHNDVFTAYPLYYIENIGCTCWGFVAGKYQTYEPWESMWWEVENGTECGKSYDMTKWFHDLYRPSLRPYDPKEIDLIRRFNRLADEDMGDHPSALVAPRTPVCAADVTMRPDGEVRTISAALKKVRELRASGAIPHGRVAEVSVEPGRYAVTDAATFAPADSNVRFVAAVDGEAVFDGGVALPPFTADADGIWRTRVPDGLAFEQLYVNGRRAQRARAPNEFWFYMGEPDDTGMDVFTGKLTDTARKALVAGNTEDMAPLGALSLDELARVEVLVWQSWDMARCRVTHADAEKGLAMLKPGTFWPLFNSRRCPRYVLENYRGALDAPGEWFHDVKAGELLYIPCAGERIETTRAVAPIAPGFTVFAGDSLSGALVRNVTFRGLAFEHAAWTLPDGGVKNEQSAQNVRSAAILGDGVCGFAMERCRISHTGMHGVWLKRGCRDSRIVRCLVEDVGGGGVYIGDTTDWKDDKPGCLTAFNCVSNCIIRSGGHVLNGAIGIWVGHASDNVIAHNDIGDFRYTGVSMGWTWGYKPTVAKRNRLLWNRIHHIGRGVLSDMGGVYTLGDSEGTEVVGNWIHDVDGYVSGPSPAFGLYTDEGSAGILFASNLVERCRDGAVNQHYGKNNTFMNNIFATFEKSGMCRFRVEDHTTIVVTNNVLWWTNSHSQVVKGGVEGGKVTDVVMDGNLYWCSGGCVSPEAFFGKSLDAWREEGHDGASRVADPLFRDPLHGDWTLAPESPALKMGFAPWDWTDAGVLKDDTAWRADAMDDVRYPPLKDAPPAPYYFRTYPTSGEIGFEKVKTGAFAGKSIGILDVSGKSGLSVTDETAASGSQSLRIEDGPVNAFPWEPHLKARLGAYHGSVRIAWSFLVDDKAHPQFECRDYRQEGNPPFAAGPSVTFSAGCVRAGGRKVVDVPLGTWARVEVVLHVTGQKAGIWSCTVASQGGNSATVDGLKVAAGFRSLDWIGFMSNGKEGVWHLDDFSVEPVN